MEVIQLLLQSVFGAKPLQSAHVRGEGLHPPHLQHTDQWASSFLGVEESAVLRPYQCYHQIEQSAIAISKEVFKDLGAPVFLQHRYFSQAFATLGLLVCVYVCVSVCVCA